MIYSKPLVPELGELQQALRGVVAAVQGITENVTETGDLSERIDATGQDVPETGLVFDEGDRDMLLWPAPGSMVTIAETIFAGDCVG